MQHVRLPMLYYYVKSQIIMSCRHYGQTHYVTCQVENICRTKNCSQTNFYSYFDIHVAIYMIHYFVQFVYLNQICLFELVLELATTVSYGISQQSTEIDVNQLPMKPILSLKPTDMKCIRHVACSIYIKPGDIVIKTLRPESIPSSCDFITASLSINTHH